MRSEVIKISSDFDGDSIKKMMFDAAHEQLAEAAADAAVEQGVSSLEDVEGFVLNLEADSPEIDAARVEEMVRAILVKRLS